MRIIFLFIICVVIASCKSNTDIPAEQQKPQTTEPGKGEPFAVQLGDGVMGQGTTGAYVVYSDSAEKHFGHNTPTIKSVQAKEFATIINSIKPEKCIGKRIEYTAWVKAKDVKGWAGLWLRIDAHNPENSSDLGFDNMQGRPITGTRDWAVYHIVLDVPQGAAALVYGALLDGDGQIWVDSMQVKIVDNTVARTDSFVQKTL